MKPIHAWLSLVASLSLASAGCMSERKWEITVENKSESPCSVFFTLGDGSSTASMEDVAKGRTVPLIVGSNNTTVRTVKIVRGDDEQTLQPNAELLPDKRYALVVDAEGKVQATIVNQ